MLSQALRQAAAAYASGAWGRAEELCSGILNAEPHHFDALNLLGIIAARTGRATKAAELLKRAVAVNPGNATVHNNYGNVLKDLGRFADALVSYERALRIDAGLAEIHNNRAVSLQELGRFAEALDAYERALELKPAYAEAHGNRGNALRGLEQFEAALDSYERALKINPGYAEAYNNRGVTLQELRRFDAALESLERALTINPSYAEAYNNRGVTLQALGRLDEALDSYARALQINPVYAEAHVNRGVTLQQMRRFPDAVACFESALKIKPDEPWLRGACVHAKSQICDWTDWHAQISELIAGIERGMRTVRPFPLLARVDSVSLQRRASEIWVNARNPARPVLPPLGKRPRHPKIRLGYYSADYRNHPTAYLLAELFESHDRERFDVVAFSFGPDEHDAMRERLTASFERFIDVRALPDRQVAELSRELEIDIAVDLKGFTQDERTGIFSYRAAPLQINYLGYPGTLGAPYMDYLIADEVLIPEEDRQFYAEKIIYLPHSYQANDRTRRIADREYSRAELQLPPSAFVFCCFNNNYKIDPETFAGWMRILKGVEGSVLWLLKDNETAAQNLRKEAAARDVSPARLIFAPRMPLHEHLARHRVADLFVDTLPCNAHTTASDALWAGLPVLTRRGESFPARVAASLLNAVGLPELIMDTQEQYEARAIEFGRNPGLIAATRHKLAANRLTTPLFDSASFARHIENAYTQIYERYHADRGPDHIRVAR
jgi:predicted O-linked N-acetylglucosamine transferase (SPINDLY family)